jgi:hypothetical protein
MNGGDWNFITNSFVKSNTWEPDSFSAYQQNLPHFVEHEGSLFCSQDPASWPYSGPHKYTTCPQSHFLKIYFRLAMQTKCNSVNGKGMTHLRDQGIDDWFKVLSFWFAFRMCQVRYPAETPTITSEHIRLVRCYAVPGTSLPIDTTTKHPTRLGYKSPLPEVRKSRIILSQVFLVFVCRSQVDAGNSGSQIKYIEPAHPLVSFDADLSMQLIHSYK